MASPPQLFTQVIDANKNPFFTADFTGIPIVNLSRDLRVFDGTYFTTRTLRVSLRATGLFSSDLTSRDDILLAFLSMFLVLVIEGIVATILLRTYDGGLVSRSGFAIKYFIEMARDFNFHDLRPRKAGKAKRRRKRHASLVLILVAVSALLFTFGLEVLVLFLTSLKLTPVTNKTVSLRVQVPIVPFWNIVRFNVRASINKPCDALAIVGAKTDKTSITACVISNVTSSTGTYFRPPEDDVKLEVVADVHRYGAEYSVSLGNLSAVYSAKALYTLDDERGRLMAQLSRKADKRREMELIQQQFIGFLFSVYLKETNNTAKHAKRALNLVNALRPDFSVTEGIEVEVIQVGDRPYKFLATRYTTRVTGKIPQGPMVLHFAHHFFRSAAAVFVAPPDEMDLLEDEGPKRVKAVVWREDSRVLNWLSLGCILTVAMVILAALRLKLRPKSIGDLAAIFVKNAVGADKSRTPAELFETYEDSLFRITPVDNLTASLMTAPIPGKSLYTYGAETEEGWDWTDLEYASTDDTSRSSR